MSRALQTSCVSRLPRKESLRRNAKSSLHSSKSNFVNKKPLWNQQQKQILARPRFRLSSQMNSSFRSWRRISARLVGAGVRWRPSRTHLHQRPNGGYLFTKQPVRADIDTLTIKDIWVLYVVCCRLVTDNGVVGLS